MVSTKAVEVRRMAGTTDAVAAEGKCIGAVAVMVIQMVLTVLLGVPEPAFPNAGVVESSDSMVGTAAADTATPCNSVVPQIVRCVVVPRLEM